MNSQHLNPRPFRSAFELFMSIGLIALSFWLSSTR